ncbi:hypothetical protein SELMODRAFT_416753 [Selaginella moellendorffii]|uniref:Fe2OG dioxygenase domain-containing protein n=1 Tax=Selaginella moellendorffii TaxID=88036 RepID=D8S0A6_SELML|nr:hypothetical protein SELMODRAFT_416753 [Selaginella moellendorffii]
MPPEASITICYRHHFQDGSGGDLWRSIALPPGDGIQDLAAACSAASFGIGGERVMDPSYRKALKLEPGDFTTSFDLSGYGILDEIKTLLFPTKQSLIAKLYKLNVYAQGDFFKPHVDTPQSGNMLASLVVSLPCAHSGGDLVVRHGKKSHSFSFGGENGNGRIGWAAFFSDCEHEVMEVTSGHRLTLTYNLFVENSTTPKTDFSGTQLYKLFVEAKESEQKMTLGFPCKHLYAQGSGLKGDDAFVYHTALSAGLNASVCSVWSREDGFRASRRNPDFDHPKEEVEIAEIGKLLHEEMEEDTTESVANEDEDDADENEDDPNTKNDTMEDDANEDPN